MNVSVIQPSFPLRHLSVSNVCTPEFVPNSPASLGSQPYCYDRVLAKEMKRVPGGHTLEEQNNRYKPTYDECWRHCPYRR